MKNVEKYINRFCPAPLTAPHWVQKQKIEKAPVWCSVDLRDGNQALAVPMDQAEKLELFRLLCHIGFREIEVGFPAASETEYSFLRELIERKLVPEDVTLQVMTQAREPILRRTFDALRGAGHAIIHLYLSTSPVQCEQVLHRSPEEVRKLAAEAARLMVQLQKENGTDYTFEFTPESFTETDPDYALSVAEAVLDEWEPTPEHKAILNLPASVELSMPHVFANTVEYIHHRLRRRDSVLLSVHTHNDRGTAVAACEMGLLAGAERIEGTLFGTGERSGNADIVTLALNLYTQGVDPGLELSDLPKISAVCERLTRSPIHERQPYSGRMVFAAYSGSHQDAIAKSLSHREKQGGPWQIPYLSVDPADIGREYEEDVIRINSQSGKGGVGYLLEHRFGFVLPQQMRSAVAAEIKRYSDRQHKVITAEDVYHAFSSAFVNINTPLRVLDYSFRRGTLTHASVKLELGGSIRELEADGRGRLDAVVNALRDKLGLPFSRATYSEHALEASTHAEAVTYVSVIANDGCASWGVGLDDDMVASSVHALIAAINRNPSLFTQNTP